MNDRDVPTWLQDDVRRVAAGLPRSHPRVLDLRAIVAYFDARDRLAVYRRAAAHPGELVAVGGMAMRVAP